MTDFEMIYRKKFETYMRTSTSDNDIDVFTREEQIERYGKALSFWSIEKSNIENKKNKKIIDVHKINYLWNCLKSTMDRIDYMFDEKTKDLIYKRRDTILDHTT